MPHKDQIALETSNVTDMYERLDSEIASARAARESALGSSAEDAQDLYTRDVQIARFDRIISERTAATHALCFGRIDFADGVFRHIGRIGLRDADGDPLLVDWRADAARPFYAATALTPEGLRRRRHLRLEGRNVAGVSDEILDGSDATPQDVLGDGPLAEALGQARTGRMREAVSTLQAEQDSIVRSEHRGITVVQGGPGTGKTIVALHRAAYVLYAFPRIAERGVLVYGPNQRFLDYISEVLPSLGENDVDLGTAVDLVGTEPTQRDSATHAEWKGRAERAAELDRRVREHRPDAADFAVRIGQSTLVVDGELVERARETALSEESGHNPARGRFVEHIVDALVELIEEESTSALEEMDAEVSEVMGIDLSKAVASDLISLGFDEAEIAEGMPEFDPEGVRTHLLEDDDLDRMIGTIWPRLDAEEQLSEYLAEHGFAREAGLSRADLALLDELRALIDGPPARSYGHLVVDEAQELTEMEWRMVMRRCPARSMTAVGDFAQSGSATTVRTWADAVRPSQSERIDVHTLSVNYRTTAEILTASEPLLNEVAPGQELSHSVRHGDTPREIGMRREDLVDAVAGLVRDEQSGHPGELVGIVCPSARMAELQAAVPDTAVVPAPESRGLEFDAVIVVDPEAIRAERPAGARDLYVASTRATKRLTTVRIS